MILHSARRQHHRTGFAHLCNGQCAVPFETHRGTGTARAPPFLSLFASSPLRSRVSSSWKPCRYLPLTCSPICRKGVSIRYWRKENAGRHGLRTTAGGTSPLRFPTYRAAMRYATDISKAALHLKKYPISGNRESKGTRVTFLRDLWTTFPFLPCGLKAVRNTRFRQAGLHGAELCHQCFQGTLPIGKL